MHSFFRGKNGGSGFTQLVVVNEKTKNENRIDVAQFIEKTVVAGKKVASEAGPFAIKVGLNVAADAVSAAIQPA